MIAIELVRREPEAVRRAMLARGEADPVDELLALDAAWRQGRTQADEIRNRRNQVNREIGHARSAGQPPSAEIIAEMRSLGDQVTQLEAGAQDAEDRMRGLLLGLPNLPLPDVPVGRDADANRIVRESGPPAAPDFPVLPHWELGEKLGIIDFQRGRETVRQPVLYHQRRRRPAGTRPDFLDAGLAHRRTRLYRAGAAGGGAARGDGRLRQPAQVRR